jgi:hypothetical protein
MEETIEIKIEDVKGLLQERDMQILNLRAINRHVAGKLAEALKQNARLQADLTKLQNQK